MFEERLGRGEIERRLSEEGFEEGGAICRGCRARNLERPGEERRAFVFHQGER